MYYPFINYKLHFRYLNIKYIMAKCFVNISINFKYIIAISVIQNLNKK